jgi:tRNA ligase
VDKLVEIGDVKGVRRPAPEEMQGAIAKTRVYKTSIIKEMKLEGLDSGSKNGGKSKGARYYGIAVEVDLDSLLADAFAAQTPEILQQLRSRTRVEKKPHVTLVHENMLELVENGSNRANVEAATTLWEKCKKAAQRFGDDVVDVTLTLGPLVVWDSRAMSIQVSAVEYGGTKVDPADLPSDEHKHSYHITVGTLEEDIRPIEGKWLLESALKGEQTSRAGAKIERAEIAEVQVRGRIRGLF